MIGLINQGLLLLSSSNQFLAASPLYEDLQSRDKQQEEKKNEYSVIEEQRDFILGELLANDAKSNITLQFSAKTLIANEIIMRSKSLKIQKF